MRHAVLGGCALGLATGWNVANLGAIPSQLAESYDVSLAVVGLFTTALFVTHLAMQIPGGRAALAAYKAQRDPSLAARMKSVQVVKYRLLRTLIELPVLTRETFEEQIAGDPLEKSKAQMMMF